MRKILFDFFGFGQRGSCAPRMRCAFLTSLLPRVTGTVPVKRHRGSRDTHGHTNHTDEPHKHPNPPTHPSDRETTESAADSTAAAPEPTAPRGRLGGRPLRTRPSRPPLHRGEPDTLTRQTTPEPRGQTTPEPRDAHIAANHRTRHTSHRYMTRNHRHHLPGFVKRRDRSEPPKATRK